MISRKKVTGISLALALTVAALGIAKALLFSKEQEVKILTTEKRAPQQKLPREEDSVNEPPEIEEKEEITGSSAININTADQARLESLPGIGPSIAEAIISHREEIGCFEQKSDIMEVSGIGEARFRAIEELICVGD